MDRDSDLCVRERLVRCEACCSELRGSVELLREDLRGLDEEFHVWIRVLTLSLVGCVLAAVFEALI